MHIYVYMYIYIIYNYILYHCTYDQCAPLPMGGFRGSPTSPLNPALDAYSDWMALTRPGECLHNYGTSLCYYWVDHL